MKDGVLPVLNKAGRTIGSSNNNISIHLHVAAVRQLIVENDRVSPMKQLVNIIGFF